MKSLKPPLVALLLFLVATSDKAVASPISYTFTGIIDQSAFPGISVGDSIIGSVIYDPDAPVELVVPSSFISFFPTVSSITATVGATSFLSTVVLEAALDDSFEALFPGVPAAVYDVFTLSGLPLDLDFFDADATFFDSLPGLPPVLPLSSFEHALLVVRGPEGFAAGHVAVTPVATVPEPATVLLLGTGMAALLNRRRCGPGVPVPDASSCPRLGANCVDPGTRTLTGTSVNGEAGQ